MIMKNLETVFRYCLFVSLIVFCKGSKAQMAIDTLFIETKLYTLENNENSKKIEALNTHYKVVEFYVTQVLDSFSNDYLFFKGEMTFDYIGGKGLHFTSVYCVWDIKNNKFIDTIGYTNFNKIIASMNTKLNCFDKAVLYELLTFRQQPGGYAYSIKFRKKYRTLYKEKFDLDDKIFATIFQIRSNSIDLSCNKKIYSLLNSSTNQIFYLPRITLSEDGRRKVKDFFIQVFYFNEGGELVNTMLLEKFMTLKPCD